MIEGKDNQKLDILSMSPHEDESVRLIIKDNRYKELGIIDVDELGILEIVKELLEILRIRHCWKNTIRR